ncbi:MAG TPA: TerB family tellurite resistance protein, partial [Longimicrobiales bacterium]|nr:TerB family tellurite resistance protein [Longimicrobiales bacterium]
RSRFGLADLEAERLIDLAERERRGPEQIERLVGMIAGQLSLERKWFLMDELWALVSVDGDATAAEVAFMEKVGYLLDVGPVDSAAARERGAAAVRQKQPGEETT